jgi:hypothetical protein
VIQIKSVEQNHTRDSRSPSSLKSYHKSKCIKKPIYYCLGTRIEQILHMRLRTTCSSLSHHLFLKNIVDSPNCSCHQGVPETNSHYLFHCHRFNDSRNPYIESIDIPMNLTVDRLLFWSQDLTDDENNSLFLNVLNLTVNSKRFHKQYLVPLFLSSF